jgi:hypothetical protein
MQNSEDGCVGTRSILFSDQELGSFLSNAGREKAQIAGIGTFGVRLGILQC